MQEQERSDQADGTEDVTQLQERRMSRRFAVLCLHTLLFQAVTFLLRVTASYSAVALDVDAARLGLLAAAFALVPLLLALPVGGLADRYGESRVMVAGSVLVAAAAGLLVAHADTFLALVSAMVVLGAGHLLCAVGQQSMVADLAPRRRLDSAFGYYTFAGSTGQVAGAGVLTLFGASAATPETDRAFLSGALLASLLVLVSLLAGPTGRREGLVRAEREGLRLVLRTPALVRGLLVSSLVLAAMDVTLVYLPLLGAEEGLTVGAVSALLTARAVATMFSRVLTGTLTAVLGRGMLLTVSIAASGVATAVLALPAPLWVLFLAVVVMGSGLGVCQPVMLAWLAEISPPNLRGRVVSVRLVGNRLGQAVIPGAVGLMAGGLGAAGVLAVTAGGLVGAALATRRVPLDHRPGTD